MDKTTTIEDVSTFDTKGGNKRYVIRDADGDEYTTFREQIGEAARRVKGKRAKITYHSEQRGQFTNVYLDSAAPAEDD